MMPDKNRDTRQKILLQALAYFLQNNYEYTKLEYIAEVLGITKGEIYHYFKSNINPESLASQLIANSEGSALLGSIFPKLHTLKMGEANFYDFRNYIKK